MFALGALTLCNAFTFGVSDQDEWDFVGIGLGSATIQLDGDVVLRQLPRLNLAEYRDAISSFDVGVLPDGLSTSEPAPLRPGGLGRGRRDHQLREQDAGLFRRSGARDHRLSPEHASPIGGLRRAVETSADLPKRDENARAMNFPRSWNETFTDAHRECIDEVFASSAGARLEAVETAAG